MASTIGDATTAITVLVPTGNQHYHLHPFLVSGRESNETIAARLSALSTVDQSDSFFRLRKAYRSATMRRLVFGKVDFSGLLDMESQTVPAHHICSATKDALMTRLISDPSALASVTGSLQDHLRSENLNNPDGRSQAWCFYYELDELAASVYILFSLLSAIALGGGAKYMGEESDLALSLATGLLAMLTTIQWAVLIRMKYSAFLG